MNTRINIIGIDNGQAVFQDMSDGEVYVDGTHFLEAENS